MNRETNVNFERVVDKITLILYRNVVRERLLSSLELRNVIKEELPELVLPAA